MFIFTADTDETKLSCRVANSAHTADTDKTSLVLSVSAVWTRHNETTINWRKRGWAFSVINNFDGRIFCWQRLRYDE